MEQSHWLQEFEVRASGESPSVGWSPLACQALPRRCGARSSPYPGPQDSWAGPASLVSELPGARPGSQVGVRRRPGSPETGKAGAAPRSYPDRGGGSSSGAGSPNSSPTWHIPVLGRATASEGTSAGTRSDNVTGAPSPEPRAGRSLRRQRGAVAAVTRGPGRAGPAGTAVEAAAAGLALGWRCSAAWWPRLSSGSRRAGLRAVTAAWRRSTAAPSAWRSTTGLWPSAAAATRECSGLQAAAGPGSATGRGPRPAVRGPRPTAAQLSAAWEHRARRTRGRGRGGAPCAALALLSGRILPQPSLLIASPRHSTRPLSWHVGVTCSTARSRGPGSPQDCLCPQQASSGSRCDLCASRLRFGPVKTEWAVVNKCLVALAVNSFGPAVCLSRLLRSSLKLGEGLARGLVLFVLMKNLGYIHHRAVKQAGPRGTSRQAPC